jgi:cytochrome c-type biogenesis protein CcmH/NrfG
VERLAQARLDAQARLAAEAGQEATFPAYDKASQLGLERVLRTDPRDAEAHYLLGRVLRRQGSEEAARRELATAVRLEPENEVYRAALESR